jgi:hypothetical protein
MNAQEMDKIDALPKGAAEIASMALDPPVDMTGCPGRNGARCSAAQMGLRSQYQL